MRVKAKETDQVFEIDAGEDAAPLMRSLQRAAPDVKLLVVSEDSRKIFIVTLSELDLDHASLSKLNYRTRLHSGDVAQLSLLGG